MAAALVRAHSLRALGGNMFRIKNPLTLSLSTIPRLREPYVYERGGWEFCGNYCDSSRLDRLKASGLRLPERYINDAEFSIKHLDSGIKFCFSAYDALLKREQETNARDPLKSDLPGYASPLLRPRCNTYDCAYVGKTVIEKADEEPQKIDPVWEDIEWKVLHEQIVSTLKNEILCGTSYSRMFLDSDDFAILKNDEPIANEKKTLGMRLYYDEYELLYTAGYFSLVITDYGWFVYLQQRVRSMYEDERTRQMTMHCDFKQPIIFREIMEDQSMDFESRVNGLSICRSNLEDDSHPWPHFHEAKQFKIQGEYMREARSSTADVTRRYTSFTVGEWAEAPHRFWDVRGSRIQSLYANGGEKLQSLEKDTNSRIQIIPLFHTPCDPQAVMFPLNGSNRKSAYVLPSTTISGRVVDSIENYIRGKSDFVTTE